MTLAPPIELSVTDKRGRTYKIQRRGGRQEYTVCRGSEADNPHPSTILIPDRMVSRRHCSLTWNDDDSWLLRDIGSTNGTFVNGEILFGEVALGDGGVFEIGGSILRLEFEPIVDDAVDQTIVASDDGATTIVAPGNSDATGVVPGDPDATIVAAGNGDATVVTPGDPDATIVAAGNGDATVVPAGDRASETDDTQPEHRPLEAKASAPAKGEPIPVETAVAPPPIFGDGIASHEDITDDRHANGFALRGAVRNLVEAGLLDETRAREFVRRAREHGETFFHAVVKDQTVRDVDEIFAWAAEYLGCGVVITEPDALFESVAHVGWLPVNVAERRGVLMLNSVAGDVVHYATTDPFDIMTRDWVERCAEKPAKMAVVLPSTFRETIKRMRTETSQEDGAHEIGYSINVTWDEAQRMQDTLEYQGVPQVVDYFLHRAYEQGASDIHVEPTEDGMLVRNRVDGVLHDENTLPINVHPAVTSRLKIMSGMDVAEKRRPQDGRISLVINKVPIDIRASSYPTVHGEKIVLRLLDRSALSPTPASLGLSDRNLAKLLDKIHAPLGLIMLCGPTGSGKTTTLYSCLGSIDRRRKNVLTVEDPVEYRLEGVHQMQVNEKIGLTFASGLRTILRQDPDVVMVGECRDDETASMAIEASNTGHVVFSTIHTNDAVGVVTRFLKLGVAPYQLSSALTLAIAQRLVRTVCTHCKVSTSGSDILHRLHTDGVSDEKLANMGISIDPDIEYVSHSGCHRCRDTGYAGRHPVFEMFEMTNKCRNIVMSDHFNEQTLREAAKAEGMTTLVASALQLVEDGVTTHEEVIRVLGEGD